MKSRLPDSYRWADSKDGSTLYLRYSWVASVERGKVEVRTRAGAWEAAAAASSMESAM